MYTRPKSIHPSSEIASSNPTTLSTSPRIVLSALHFGSGQAGPGYDIWIDSLRCTKMWDQLIGFPSCS